jgi:carbamate kinase
MLTDVAGIYAEYGTQSQRAIRAVHPDALEKMQFDAGSMGPKVIGFCEFARATGKISAIGRLSDLEKIVDGEAGTLISNDVDEILYF